MLKDLKYSQSSEITFHKFNKSFIAITCYDKRKSVDILFEIYLDNTT